MTDDDIRNIASNHMGHLDGALQFDCIGFARELIALHRTRFLGEVVVAAKEVADTWYAPEADDTPVTTYASADSCPPEGPPPYQTPEGQGGWR